jgi:hypothetical protein
MNNLDVLSYLCLKIQEHFGDRLGGIYTSLPSKPNFPYVYLELKEQKSNLRLSKLEIQINILSNYKGIKQIYQLTEELQNFLRNFSWNTKEIQASCDLTKVTFVAVPQKHHQSQICMNLYVYYFSIGVL